MIRYIALWPHNLLHSTLKEQSGRAIGEQAGSWLWRRQTMRGQVHARWVQQSEAALYPGYSLSPRLEKYPKCAGQTPGEGMDHSAKAGMAETGAANINTRSARGPKHERCRCHIHSHIEQRAARPLPLFSATGREASLQRPWLQQRAVLVIAAPTYGSVRSMPGNIRQV